MNLFRKYKTFDEILPSFLSGKKIEVNTKSYSGYVGKTKVFSQWLLSHGYSDLPLKKIPNEAFIAFYNDYLSGERGLDRPTVKKYYEAISAVFRYALDMEEIDFMPTFKGVKFPKKGKDCSAQLIPEDILPNLLDDIHKNDPQLYLATMLEYYCGVRPGREARLIKANAFNLKDGVLKIDQANAKTGKARFVTMSDDLIEICKEYGIGSADPTLYVFGKNKSFHTKPVSENMLRYRFNQFREKHGLPEGVKLYSMKHVGSSNLIKITDIVTVQHHLGHSNITSTAHYLKRISKQVDKNIKFNFPSPLRKVDMA